MNTLQNFFKRSLGIRNNSSHNDHQHNHNIYKVVIELDKDEFKSNDKITGKLLIQTHDLNIKDIGKICVRFYDELDIQWEEYQTHTLYNTVQYKTFKKPLKINIESILDPENAIYVNEIDNAHIKHHQKLYEYCIMFEFELPKFIHSTVTMPNASYAYYIEAFINNDYSGDRYTKMFENFKATSHNSYKTDVNIYNQILTPNELLMKPLLNQPQITEIQTSSTQIRVTIPKRVFFSNEIIPIKIDVEELGIAFNTATSTITTTLVSEFSKSSHHHIKLNKVVFKLYQYCKICAEEPEGKVKVFDYLIKQTVRKINDKCEFSSSKISLTEEFLLPDQLFSSTNREIFDEFNRSNLLMPKNIPTLSYACDEKVSLTDQIETLNLETATNDSYSYDDDDSFNEFNDNKLFYGVCVNYKLVIEIWKNFMHQDSVICIPIMIDPEA